jgi:7-cyano-7-deazaguanine synthase
MAKRKRAKKQQHEKPRTSAVVLLSGGQDSTTCLFWAKQKFDDVHALAFSYGQRHREELRAASHISVIAKTKSFVTLDLHVLEQLGDSALLQTRGDREIEASGGLKDEEMPEGLPTSFVPGRNLLFLSAAAAYAVKVGARDLVTGVCQADYSGYPDCRQLFVEHMVQVIEAAMPSSTGPWTIHAPLMNSSKKDTVELAKVLGEDCWRCVGLSVTCYNGRPACGRCPACKLRARGFEEAGLEDPAPPPRTPLEREPTLQDLIVTLAQLDEDDVSRCWVLEELRAIKKV